jgi:hypothetical protein
LFLLDADSMRFMGTVGVPERYSLPKEGQIIDVRYLYCHPRSRWKTHSGEVFRADTR